VRLAVGIFVQFWVRHLLDWMGVLDFTILEAGRLVSSAVRWPNVYLRALVVLAPPLLGAMRFGLRLYGTGSADSAAHYEGR